MNKNIFNFYNKKDIIPNIILPHQLATVDFLLREAYDRKNNCLIYHQMGTGKTILNLLFGLLISKTNKVLIVVSSNNLVHIWSEQLNKLLVIVSNSIEFNLNNIEIITRNKFINEVERYNYNNIKIYQDYFIIIDEIHNYFNNNLGNILVSNSSKIGGVLILVTGTPIYNTLKSLNDLISLLYPESKINLNKYITGNKVFEIKINEEGKDLLIKKLKNNISYYFEETKNKINFLSNNDNSISFIDCRMSEVQIENYNRIKENINLEHEMFSKYMNNISLAALGSISNYNNLGKKDSKISDTLEIKNGKLIGEDLKTLNFSSKLKYFKTKYLNKITREKKFIYFNNSSVGTFVLQNVLRENGISEFGKSIVNNYRCLICNEKRNCETCIPAKYYILTSLSELSDINSILKIYNDSSNDKGNNIVFLFGSKIMSEAYTLLETKYIIFLTIPSNKAELDQIIARTIRKFSFKNPEESITVELLVATTKDLDFITEKNLEYILNNSETDFDVKKILYLNSKALNTDEVLSILKQGSLNYNGIPHKILNRTLIYESLKYYFFSHKYLKPNSIFNILNCLDISKEDISDFIKFIESKSIFFFNRDFKTSIFYYFPDKNLYHLLPVRLNQKDYFMRLII